MALDVVVAAFAPAILAEVDTAAGVPCGAAAAGGGVERFVVNALASPDRRLQEVKENSLRSFNEAARFTVDYVEFDVQVRSSALPFSALKIPSLSTSNMAANSSPFG
uniref:GP-PDE domain-containing protein n=2 Tax=Oryza brachyantha TaxID=4533 RepID=J3KXK1_ORYBR